MSEEQGRRWERAEAGLKSEREKEWTRSRESPGGPWRARVCVCVRAKATSGGIPSFSHRMCVQGTCWCAFSLGPGVFLGGLVLGGLEVTGMLRSPRLGSGGGRVLQGLTMEEPCKGLQGPATASDEISSFSTS